MENLLKRNDIRIWSKLGSGENQLATVSKVNFTKILGILYDFLILLEMDRNDQKTFFYPLAGSIS